MVKKIKSLFKKLPKIKIKVGKGGAKSKRFAKLVLTIGIIVLVGFILDLGSYLYFKKNVLAYTTKSGIVITKSQVAKRLFEVGNPLTPVTVQQLINDVLVTKLTDVYAAKNKVIITEAQVTQFLEESKKQNPSLDINDPVLRENVKKYLILKALAVKEPVTVTDEEIRRFYNENKEALFKDKKFEEVKEDIRLYLENQKIQEQIINWLDQKRKEEGFVDLNQAPLPQYKPGVGLKEYLPILVKSLFTM